MKRYEAMTDGTHVYTPVHNPHYPDRGEWVRWEDAQQEITRLQKALHYVADWPNNIVKAREAARKALEEQE